jgi:hypothetical protein
VGFLLTTNYSKTGALGKAEAKITLNPLKKKEVASEKESGKKSKGSK